MKRIIKTSISALVAVGLLGTYSCVEPDDLITEGAKEGGLVAPVSANLSFVGDPVTVTIEATDPGIEEISFYKTYTEGGVESAEVLDQTVTVVNGEVTFTSDYAELKAGIAGMPDLATDLAIGDFWTFRVVSTLAGGREVQSGIKIKVNVDNFYSGVYSTNGTRWNFNTVGDADTSTDPPTGFTSASTWNFDTELTTVDETTCRIHCGNDNGGFGYMHIKVNPDNSVDIISTNETGLANLVQLAGWPSTYDPGTKTFVLHYQYTNDTGTHRVLKETLTKQ